MGRNDIKAVDLVRVIHNNSAEIYIEKPVNTRDGKRSSAVIGVVPITGIDYHLITLTAFDKNGHKNTQALPLSHFLMLVEDIELSAYKVNRRQVEDGLTPFGFENILIGSSVSGVLKEFLNARSIHRFAFIRDEYLGQFLKDLNTASTKERWSAIGVNVSIKYQ